MAGSARYNGPGAALRGQSRPARQTRQEDSSPSSSMSPTERQRTRTETRPDRGLDRTPDSRSAPSHHKDLPDHAGSRGPALHQRQWSDASSVQHPYPSGSPASPPPRSASPSSNTSSYYASPQHPYGSNGYSSQIGPRPGSPPHQRQYGYSSPSSQRPYVPGPGSAGSRSDQYGHYDQSPMMSPTSPDSWRSNQSTRPYPSHGQAPVYQPSSQYRPQPGDDRGSRDRSRKYQYDSDSDDYSNRNGYGRGQGQRRGQGPGQDYGPSHGARTLSYSTSIASNTSSVLAARRERSERQQRDDFNRGPPQDDWLTSPTGTENETEIAPWSDDEAIVVKAVRSPRTGYSKEKNLPAIPSSRDNRGPPPPAHSSRGGRGLDSDMIKVEVGGATTTIPTTGESSGIHFIKNVPPSTSSPPPSRLSPSLSGPAPFQTMTGAAASLRSGTGLSDSSKPFSGAGTGADSSPSAPNRSSPLQSRATARRLSSEWGGQRISLDDMLSSPSPLTKDASQRAMSSWRTSPPLQGRQDKKPSDLKSKRRSSLPGNLDASSWNDHAETWRNSIGQKRASWLSPSKGDEDKKKALGPELDVPARGLFSHDNPRRRSRSLSPTHKGPGTPDLEKNPSLKKSAQRDSFESVLSRSRSRSRSRSSRSRFSLDRSRSRSRSVSRSFIVTPVRSRPQSEIYITRGSFDWQRTRSRSRSYSRSRSRTRSPSPLSSGSNRLGSDGKAGERDSRVSNRYSWRSNEEDKVDRRSWESDGIQESKRKSAQENESGSRSSRYSSAVESHLTGHDTGLRNGSQKDVGALTTGKYHEKKAIEDDTDSMDSPPLKVQYARRPDPLGDDDDQPISSKHPASIISTFSLPPATSPTSPHPPPPPVPPLGNTSQSSGQGRSGDSAATTRDYLNYQHIKPPSIPASPPLAPQQPVQNHSVMTSVTNMSIEATTATAFVSSSRDSVGSFKIVRGQKDQDSADGVQQSGMGSESEFESDGESLHFHRPKSPSSATATSLVPTTVAPISIITSQLSRNESSTSSISIASARSAKSFLSSSSVQSASSILSGSPPPQHAPPPVPSSETKGPVGEAKRSGSAGSARGARSGLSKQILPQSIPAPPGPPPPSTAGPMPPFGIAPPPIPESFHTPVKAASEPPASAPTSSAIQIQMLTDDDHSRSQLGAISLETDDRLLTRLNNRVAQLEKELEFAHQDLESSLDEASALQTKVQDLEQELDDFQETRHVSRSDDAQENKNLQAEWDNERSRLLRDLSEMQVDQEKLRQRLEKERSHHLQDLEAQKKELHNAALLQQTQLTQELKDLQVRHAESLAEQKVQLEQSQKDVLSHLLAEQKARMEEDHRKEVSKLLTEQKARWEEDQQRQVSKLLADQKSRMEEDQQKQVSRALGQQKSQMDEVQMAEISKLLAEQKARMEENQQKEMSKILVEQKARMEESQQMEVSRQLTDQKTRMEEGHKKEFTKFLSEQKARMEDGQQKGASKLLNEQRMLMEERQQEELSKLLEQLQDLSERHDKDMKNIRSSHATKMEKAQKEWKRDLEEAHQLHRETAEKVKAAHQQELKQLRTTLSELEASLKRTKAEREEAIKDLDHHRKETEQALDRLEVVLAEDKQAHAKAIENIERKSKKLLAGVQELVTSFIVDP